MAMSFYAKLFAGFVLVSAFSAASGVAKDKFMIKGDVPESMIDMSQVQLDQRQAFFRAPPGPKRGEKIKRLFSNPTAEFINARCSDPDTGIALYAAWKRLELQVIARHIGTDRGSTEIKIPRKLTREFLGYVEGRLSVSLPTYWLKNVVHSRHTQWARFGFPVTKYSPWRGDTSKERLIPDFREDGDFLRIEVYGGLNFQGRDQFLFLPDGLAKIVREKIKRNQRVGFTAIATDERMYISMSFAQRTGCTLICLLRSSPTRLSKEAWRRDIDGYWSDHYKGSTFFTEFRLTGKYIYLFSSTHDSIGIECLIAETGKHVFTFNTSAVTTCTYRHID